MKKILLFTAIALGLSNNLFSLKLYDLAEVISNSATVREKRIDVQYKKIDIDNQLYEYLPDLRLKYNASLDSLFKQDYATTHSLSLVSSWDLLQSGNRVLTHLTERLEYEGILMDFDDTYQSELYTAASLYFEALKAKWQYDFAVSNETLSRVQYDYVRVRHDIGKVSDVDFITAQADYNNAQYQLKAYKIAYDNSLSQLARQLQMREVTPEEFEYPALGKITNLNSEEYLKNNYEIMKAQNSLEILKLEKISATKNRWAPSLALNTGIDWANMNTASSSQGSWTNSAFDANINLSVSFPIFENNENLNAIKKVKLSIKKAEIELTNTLVTKKLELDEYVADYNNKIELVSISSSRLESAKLSYEKTKQSYQLGLKSQIELYESEKLYHEARQDYIFNFFEVYLLRLKIGKLLGNTFLFL